MYGNFLAVTLFKPTKPLLPFKTYEELQSKLRTGECRLITSYSFTIDFAEFVTKLNSTSLYPIQIISDYEVLRISEHFHDCVVGLNFFNLFSFLRHKDCSLFLFDFNLEPINYALIVRKDFPHLRQIQSAFSFTSIPDAYDRLLQKYAGLLGNRTECEKEDLSATPLGFWQLADAFWILLFVSGTAILVLIIEHKWQWMKFRFHSLKCAVQCFR